MGIQKLPVVWVDKLLTDGNLRSYYVAIDMIDNSEREVRCRIECAGAEFMGYFPFDVLVKYKIPIRPAQMFRLFVHEDNGELMSWMEQYQPPMTPKKQKLLDSIMKL